MRQRSTSVAPSVMRMLRNCRYHHSSGSSLVRPMPPWTWMERSTTRLAISVHTHLTM